MKVWVLSHDGEHYGVYSTLEKARAAAAKLEDDTGLVWDRDDPRCPTASEAEWTDTNWVIEPSVIDAEAN